jgi:hypothetical protein
MAGDAGSTPAGGKQRHGRPLAAASTLWANGRSPALFNLGGSLPGSSCPRKSPVRFTVNFTVNMTVVLPARQVAPAVAPSRLLFPPLRQPGRVGWICVATAYIRIYHMIERHQAKKHVLRAVEYNQMRWGRKSTASDISLLTGLPKRDVLLASTLLVHDGLLLRRGWTYELPAT